MPTSRKRVAKSGRKRKTTTSSNTSGRSALLASPSQQSPSPQLPTKVRRALFYRAALAQLPPVLPRAVRIRVAKVQSKIQTGLTRPQEIEIDQQTLLQSIPPALQAEYAACEELVNKIVLGELDPMNANGEAWRQARREKDLQAQERELAQLAQELRADGLLPEEPEMVFVPGVGRVPVSEVARG